MSTSDVWYLQRFLSSRFSIMFYAITKRIIQGAVSFIIMVVAFGFAFFVISFGSDNENFQNPGKSLLKIIVMILGEFEFDTLYYDSKNEDILTLVFTMTLLIGLIIFGSLIMINLIVAIIVSDVNSLATAAKQQVLVNKVRKEYESMHVNEDVTSGQSCSPS